MNARAVAGLVPHAGAMCLLDRVIEWSATGVRCAAVSHRDPANPLRLDGALPASAAIEYAAQAMAVHGALLAGDAGTPRPGMLASARDVRLQVARLDDLAADLNVRVTTLSRDATSLRYDFSIDADGQPVAAGRIAVVLL